jgi:alanyl-tRNA synthetase
MASRPTSETSSRSSRSSPGADGEVRAHSAVHVLKGAVTRVLGPRRFTNSQATGGVAGILKARADAPPTSEEVSKIEVAANDKIAEDAEVLEFSMDRQEAEGHFGTGIYDLCPAPAGEELLSIVRIPDWEASCCTEKHVETAGAIGAIRIDGAAFDGSAKEVELRFHLVR